MSDVGALTFARYAYPPNALGYCGPDDHAAILEYAAAGAADGGLVALARQFEGAWPYLELLAAAAGHGDPLAPEVVEAYWVGGALLDRATGGRLARSVLDRFRARAGADIEAVLDVVRRGGAPHHSFHVLAVSPWVGLLRAGHVDPALRVLDRCRIRAGTVVGVHDGDRAAVRLPALAWDGRTLALGPSQDETFQVTADGYRLAADLAVGDTVTTHWDWICERVTPARHAALAAADRATLAAVNRTITASAIADLLA
jgi:hypothetical protein